MNILVTGGAGYIGSHTSIELINAGYEVIIVDNLCNSSFIVVDRIQEITVVKQIDHIETIEAFSIAGYRANRPIEN